MSDEYTETSHQGGLSRIGNSFVGVLFGLLLFGGSFVLLFWNEGRAVRRARDLAEGARNVVTVEADRVDPAHEGKLVHITAEARTEEILTDPDFGISANALALRREVEMYQWKEKKETERRKTAGGGETRTTRYTYRKVWSNNVIDSGRFRHPQGHENPGSKPFPDTSTYAERITAGAFTLSPSLVRRISHFEPARLSQETLNKVPAGTRERLKLSGESYYLGDDPSSPQIGDVRISFAVAPPGPVSLVARQKGSSFEPYITSAGNPIEFLYAGRLTAQEIFAKEVQKNTILTWVLRGAGALAMWMGLMMIAGPLTALGNIIPFFGNLLEAGLGVFAGLVTLVLSLITISIAWVAWRPLLAGCLLAGAAAALFLLRSTARRRHRARTAAVPLPPLPPTPPQQPPLPPLPSA